MTLNELRYIVAVADLRHFGRAARTCCVSQPTLSTQIRKLEEGLGVTLFERTNKSVRPTPVGEQVARKAHKARKILDEIEDIRMMCRGLMRPLCGSRALGVIPTLAPYLLPRPPPMRAPAAVENQGGGLDVAPTNIDLHGHEGDPTSILRRRQHVGGLIRKGGSLLRGS